MAKDKVYAAAVFFSQIAFSPPAAAQTASQVVGAVSGSSDPFSTLETKGTDLIGILQGNLAVVVLTLVIIGAAAAWLFGKLRPDIAIKIIVGAVIFGSAGAIATWLLH